MSGKGFPSMKGEVRITQAYGVKNPALEPTKGGINIGTDFAVPKGTPIVLPTGQWKVVKAVSGVKGGYIGHPQPYGNTVMVQNTQTGEKIRFSHLSAVRVNLGDVYKGGIVLGNSGATGNVTGPHVDMEYYNGSGKRGDIMGTPYGNFYKSGTGVSAPSGAATSSSGTTKPNLALNALQALSAIRNPLSVLPQGMQTVLNMSKGLFPSSSSSHAGDLFSSVGL